MALAHQFPHAYSGSLPAAGSLLSQWSFEPLVVIALVVAGYLYVRGVRRIPHGVNVRLRAASFAAGWLALVVALVSPLDRLAAVLFAAHMTQHELLMVVAAPLCVLARPGVVFLHALPAGWGQRLGRLPRAVGVAPAWEVVAGPISAWVLHGAALWIWHLPALYQAALADDLVHALEHLSFFGTAILFWRALVRGRYGRLGYGVSVLYVFTTAVHNSLLGALLTVAPRVWYPAYGASSRQWGLTPLEDQQLAGLVMWVPAGLIFTLLGLGLFAAWLGESERRVAYTQSERLSRAAARGGAREA
jgi:putative membrane protein